jgi:hypothetical protein
VPNYSFNWTAVDLPRFELGTFAAASYFKSVAVGRTWMPYAAAAYISQLGQLQADLSDVMDEFFIRRQGSTSERSRGSVRCKVFEHWQAFRAIPSPRDFGEPERAR